MILRHTIKPVLNDHSKEDKNVFKTDNHLMQVKSIAECSFCVFKTFVLSILSGRYRQVSL